MGNSSSQDLAHATGNHIIDQGAFDLHMDKMARTLSEKEYLNQTRQMIRDGMGHIVYNFWKKHHPDIS
jgi:hypothetical protein